MVAAQADWKQFLPRTINGNGNGLMEGITIGADECGDLSKLVELQVLSRDTLSWLSLDDLEFDVVGLRDCENGG